MHDVWVVGHVTIDRIATPAGVLERAGGTATYFSLALARLGGDVAVLTRMAHENEQDLLAEERAAGIEVQCSPSPKTTEFENRYLPEDRDRRVQRVGAVALPFTSADLDGVQASLFHLGPLTHEDMSLDFIAAAADVAPVSLDVQGLVRRIERGRVELVDWPDKQKGLARVSIVKADEDEARVLTGERDAERSALRLAEWGPEEVLVTRAGKGSVVCHRGEVHHVPAVATPDAVDPTGCGDTFMAGYVFTRLAEGDPVAAARFGAAAAASKLRHVGPFDGSRETVDALLVDPGRDPAPAS
jgi:sugar/nucleoside kinase (ribokinase family)